MHIEISQPHSVSYKEGKGFSETTLDGECVFGWRVLEKTIGWHGKGCCAVVEYTSGITDKATHHNHLSTRNKGDTMPHILGSLRTAQSRLTRPCDRNSQFYKQSF